MLENFSRNMSANEAEQNVLNEIESILLQHDKYLSDYNLPVSELAVLQERTDILEEILEGVANVRPLLIPGQLFPLIVFFKRFI